MHNQLAEQFLDTYSQGLFLISHVVRRSPQINVPKENLPSLIRFIQNSKEPFNCSCSTDLKKIRINYVLLSGQKGFIKDT